MENQEISIFRELFSGEYPYIELSQIANKVLKNYLSQACVANESISMQLSLCADWCLATQQCDIQE